MIPRPRRRLTGGLLVGLAAAALAAFAPGRLDAQQASRAPAAPRGRADSLASRDRSLVTNDGGLRLECVGCHPSTHGELPDPHATWSAVCTTCHARAHDAVVALYAGTGRASGIRADTMFRARVDCRGCHTDAALAAGTPRAETMDRVCTECHGPAFERMATRWVHGLDWRMRAAAGYVSGARGDPRLASRRATSLSRAADSTLALVVRGDGVHNIPGADALLRAAVARTDSAYRVARVPAPAPPSLGPDPASTSCAHCHYGIETVEPVAGSAFSHADHLVSADVACSSCHSRAGFFLAGGGRHNPQHGKTTVSPAACSNCHHVASKLGCTSCHVRQDLAGGADRVTLALRLQPEGAPESRPVDFKHADHPGVECTSCHTSRSSIRTVAACADCHVSHHREGGACATCHGTKLLAEHTNESHLTCTRCHATETVALLTPDRSFCLSCHVDQADHKTGRECSTCHMQMSPAELRARILGRGR